jgi:small subunit ribosomal protein S18
VRNTKGEVNNMVELPEEVRNMAAKTEEKRREYRSDGRRDSRGGDRGDRGDRGERGGYRGGGGDKMGAAGGPGGQRRPFQRRRRRMFGGGKVCNCCVQKLKHVDYKDIDFLQRFVSSQGKILPRRLSGACARHQRMLTMAIKRARNIALLPFTA